jgi:CDP-6-deoxy-D-xylo-4-hexulose-3-dehydrase
MLGGWLSQGDRVRTFERRFASYIGMKHGVMVNSGSSANLIALSAISQHKLRKRIEPGDEVITPAVTWATTVYPICDVGALPVLVDVDLDTYNINVGEMARAVGRRTKAIMPVHLLGNPCEIREIMKVAEEHDLYVVEDSCEAHGAQSHGKKVGSFGDLSTFSFFVSHHITTIEGGMTLTNDDNLAEQLRGLREFGWIRHMRRRRDIVRRSPEYLDPRFLFLHRGFNLRATEIQASFGLDQLPKLEAFISKRRENAEYWLGRLKGYSDLLILPRELPKTRHVWFGYPITVRPDAPFSRKQIVDYLELCQIETRPVMAGNMAEQPVMSSIPHRRIGSLKNARLIMRNSFFFGNHPGIGGEEREYIADCLDHFISTHDRK